MGESFWDRYSYLHFAVGVIAYFFDIPLVNWIVIHAIFEMLENTKSGVYFIDNYIEFWPGGKQKPDRIINSIGDTIFAILGWLSVYFLDEIITH
jgi:hypothetical protein